jgi:hypothetical protein
VCLQSSRDVRCVFRRIPADAFTNYAGRMTLAVEDEPFIPFFTLCLKESSFFHSGHCFVGASSSSCDRPRLYSRDDTDLSTDRKTEFAIRAAHGGVTMSDVENEMDVLQRKLVTKTREIEALVAEQQHLGDLNAMDSTDYARLRTYIEELIYKWQEAKVRPSESNPDTEVNRLIAEREEIEEEILQLQVR